MNIVLLSGGSGKRLWPLSNDIRSKQFIKIFKNAEGEYESMVQRVYRQIRKVDPQAAVTIATSRAQVSAIHNQLGTEVGISVEPCRRDTFPAILLAAAYLHYEKRISREEAVIVCPVDPYVEDSYFKALAELGKLAEEGRANLALMGIQPTYPSAKYGYILPKTGERISPVESFREKPSEELAEQYIAKGALWNGGIFAFQLGYLLDRGHELVEFTDYKDLYQKYDTLEKISFDYAVVEKETSIQVMRYHGQWKDLGTWNTLTEAMEEHVVGNGIIADTCENLHILNELNIPILCMGIKDAVVSASPEGILVSDKHQSSYIKPYVDKMAGQVMFAEKSWGIYMVCDVEENAQTIKVTLTAGHHMHYHSHARRTEIWTVISGEGYVVLDGEKRAVATGDVIHIPIGCKHTIYAETELKVMEVQMGTNIDVSDKVKHHWQF